MAKSDYRCFLYRQVDGETITHICSGKDAKELEFEVDAALDEGWHTTFADFIDGVHDITEEKAEELKDVCSIAAADANILANAERITDMDQLKEAYARMTGSEMDKRVKSIKGVRNVIKKALGESNVNK
jgi:hypothetical protein